MDLIILCYLIDIRFGLPLAVLQISYYKLKLSWQNGQIFENQHFCFCTFRKVFYAMISVLFFQSNQTLIVWKVFPRKMLKWWSLSFRKEEKHFRRHVHEFEEEQIP